jgi:2-dehydro-3-deoxy-D-arabinonate dehydratase
MSESIKLYKTKKGLVAEHANQFFMWEGNWQQTVNRKNLFQYLRDLLPSANQIPGSNFPILEVEAPIDTQEVWAAGVTYLRSKSARMDESKQSGADIFYDKVYEAERPEIFFKATAHRVVGHNQSVRIRKDSTWNVPEPELTLFISSEKTIEGYTIGNDMSSRSIEGENPLYLPQAKSYDGCAALGPCLLIPEKPISLETGIHLTIERKGLEIFSGSAKLSQMKRSFTELAGWLTRECSFPTGVYLMTGTCLVPDHDFTLQPLDTIHITIDGIGALSNSIAID